MLDVLLEETKTYQDATKELFLEKVEEAFKKFKNNGDVHLLRYNGVCVSQFCPNIGCNGFSFIGNKSDKHLDLIFEISEEDVLDIYHCHGFQTHDRNKDSDFDDDYDFRIESIEIDIKKDEEANFIPTVDFLIRQQKCKSAYEELLPYQNEVIGTDLYLPWLEKHAEIFEQLSSFSSNYTWVDEFHLLYYRLNEVNEYLLNRSEAKKAIEEYHQLNNEEINLLKWLLQYDLLRGSLMLFLYQEIDFEFPEKTPYFDIGCFKINMLDFEDVAKFIFLFDQRQNEMWNKYLTISEEEYNQALDENNDISEDYYSLSYHLKKRGII